MIERLKNRTETSKGLLAAALGLTIAAGALLGGAPVSACAPILEKGDRVAIVGDSITEQKLYSMYIEAYLLACAPQLDLHMMQFGWGGERAPGFAERMGNDLMPWQPDVVTTCYGMNDGSYTTYTQEIGRKYDECMRDIVTRLKDAGATVVVGSPGVVDSDTFRSRVGSVVYNENLAQLGALSERIAADEAMPFANVHTTMMQAMQRAKAVLGSAYHVGGTDGVHPRENGHLLMAYAFLAQMGLDGQIGAIDVDWKATATASDGHRIVASRIADAAVVEVESSRFPFCFTGEATDPNGTRSILPFTDFQQRMNRLTLRVANLPTERAEVKWGAASKTFSRRQLAAGVNLASEFLDNPFSEPFGKVLEAVAAKQAYETHMIKSRITAFRGYVQDFGADAANKGLNAVRDLYMAKHAEFDGAARAAVVGVLHTIEIKPIAQ